MFESWKFKGITLLIDASSVVWTLIYNGKLANQIARIVAIVVKKNKSAYIILILVTTKWFSQALNYSISEIAHDANYNVHRP